MSDVQVGAYLEGKQAGKEELLHYYSAALDEIYKLRVALAIEADTQAGNLNFKTFPKSQRKATGESIQRMQACAIGGRPERYDSLSLNYLDGLFLSLGGERTLTRHSWEREVDSR